MQSSDYLSVTAAKLYAACAGAQRDGRRVTEVITGDTNADLNNKLKAAHAAAIDAGAVAVAQRKIGRNESCPCGSGKKFKKCHGWKLGRP